jgi:hypothetical protein
MPVSLDADPGARSAVYDEEEGEVVLKKIIIIGAGCILDVEIEGESDESSGSSIIGFLLTIEVDEDKEEVDKVGAETNNL